jgi:hypothetical protein
MSPKIELEVDGVSMLLKFRRKPAVKPVMPVYNETTGKVCLNVSQKFRIFASPFSAVSSK